MTNRQRNQSKGGTRTRDKRKRENLPGHYTQEATHTLKKECLYLEATYSTTKKTTAGVYV